ncbi:ferredoxin--NADP reductase [Limibacter armeniacum]|uniref:ferredoxin--NADP reductase n=1 Tax=Limibacter armeniacum TaxID=466084 RepID=UPI002FE520CA
MNDYYTLKVKEVVKETDDAVTLRFKQPIFKKIKYQSGQFLTLIFNIDGIKSRRSYSMCSTPSLDSTIDVTVKRVEGGLVSNYINDHITEGSSVEVMQPMGLFTFEPDKSKSRHIVLWGAGSGITPLMSIMKSVLFFEPESKVSLVYGNRTEDSIIFKDKLDILKERFGDRLQVVHVLSRPDHTWGGYSGRIDDIKVVNIMNKLPKMEEARHFLCGPEGLMESVKTGLKTLRVSNSSIHYESFVPKQDAVAEDISTHKVKVILDGEEDEFTVTPDKTILEAGLDEGLDLPYSCQSGVCTACRGKCISGKVQMTEHDALSEDEIKQGYVLTCQSHPMTDNVVIEMG